jgi:restriction modification system DNA specificity domain protein
MSEWPMVKLGDLGEFINGFAFKPSDWSEDGTPIIRIQNLTNPQALFNRTTKRVKDVLYVEPGDLLVSWSATLGVFRWQGKERAVLNQHIFKVVSKPIIENEFLEFSLKFALQQVEKYLHGATMRHVNRQEFLDLKIPLPPLGEQKRIAEILGGVSKAIQKTKVQLLLVDSLGENKYLSLSKDADTFKSLKDLGVKKITGKSIVAKPDNEHDVNQIIKVSAVSSGRFIASEAKPLPADYEPNNLHEIHQGDLLFARASGSANLLGACCIVDKEIQHLYLPDKVWKLEVDEDILPKVYLLQALRGREFRSVAESHFSSSTGVKNIKTSVLMEFKIPVLKQGQFNDYVHFVKTLDNLRHLLHRKLSLLQELQKSLASRAFAGLL